VRGPREAQIIPDNAFERSVLGAGVGFLGTVVVMSPLLISGQTSLSAGNLFTMGSFSTLGAVLGSSAGHFYAGDPVRGVGLGALGTATITGASLVGLVAGSALGGGSTDALAAASFAACTGAAVGWTMFMASDARQVAAKRREVALAPNHP
jgi:hypothetical protein